MLLNHCGLLIILTLSVSLKTTRYQENRNNTRALLQMLHKRQIFYHKCQNSSIAKIAGSDSKCPKCNDELLKCLQKLTLSNGELLWRRTRMTLENALTIAAFLEVFWAIAFWVSFSVKLWYLPCPTPTPSKHTYWDF